MNGEFYKEITLEDGEPFEGVLVEHKLDNNV